MLHADTRTALATSDLRGIATEVVQDPPWKAMMRRRDDVTGVPWCFRADERALTAESGVKAAWDGEALVLDRQDGSEPERVEPWFPKGPE